MTLLFALMLTETITYIANTGIHKQQYTYKHKHIYTHKEERARECIEELTILKQGAAG